MEWDNYSLLLSRRSCYWFSFPLRYDVCLYLIGSYSCLYPHTTTKQTTTTRRKKHLEITQTKMKTNPNIMMIIRSLFTYSLFGAKKKKKKKVTGVFVCLS